MRLLSYFQIVMTFSSSTAFVSRNDKYVFPGNLTLGGLFPIHSTYYNGKCAEVQGQDGIQAVEAMRFAVARLSVPVLEQTGIRLGMVAVDTCESETVALDNTNELLDMRINKKVRDESCTCKSREILQNNLIGVVGPASSKLSIPVASLLRLFKVPQISYQSTSPELNDRTRFKYFKRTVPSDNYQAAAIAGILRYMGYQYITIVYEDSSYGSHFRSTLEAISKNGDFCIGLSVRLPYSASEATAQATVKQLLHHRNTKGKVVSVLILRPLTALRIFKAARLTSRGESFHFIGTDGWTGRMFSDPEVKEIVEGSVGIQLFMGVIPGFKEYFDSLQRDHPENPWWSEFVQSYDDGECDNNKCDLEEFGILHFIVDAVLAFAYAIKDMHGQYCKEQQGVCPEMKQILSTRPDLLSFLSNVSFTETEGGNFHFVNGSEGPVRYSILGFNSNKKHQWEVLGNYSGIGDQGEVFMTKDADKYGDKSPSVCSEPCPAGYAKLVSDDRCCWQCIKCTGNQYVGGSGCMPCSVGFHPNLNRTNCSPVTVEHMDYNSSASIATMVVSFIGIALCLFVIVVFIIYRETPLVKATDYKLSLTLICCLILSYASSVVFLAKPSVVTCGFTRYLLGLCYTIQYAILLTKTIRIYRLFQAKSPEKKKFVNSRSSMTMTLLITFIHVLGLTIWIIFDTPYTIVEYKENRGILICSDAQNYSYAYSLSYSVALLIACVIFAIKTRKIPDGFKETRFISICSYTTCIIWLAFASTFFFTNNNVVRILSLCITLSINSTVTLCVLFVSRVYIILLKPSLNTRERVMTRAHETKSDTRSSACLTSNKAVSTDDLPVYTRNGFLAVPTDIPEDTQGLTTGTSDTEERRETRTMNNKRDIPLKNIPKLTINGHEFSV